jgi:hypothetical protein
MRKLIEIRYPYDDLRWLDCKLTKQGRAVVRAGLRLEAPKKAPMLMKYPKTNESNQANYL